MTIENHLVGIGGENKVSTGGVHDALGFSGRAGGIEDEEGIFGVHPFGRAVCGGLGHFLMPPEVFPGVPFAVDLIAHALDDDHLFHEIKSLDGGVGAVLLGNSLGAAEGPVAGDQNLGPAVFNAVAKRIGAESAENDAVNGADAGAGQHGNGELGNHGQVDLNPVALLDALGLQNVGELADFLMHLLVSQCTALRGFIAFPLNGNLVGPCLQVFVEAVIGHIEFSAFKILQINGALADIKVIILDFVPFFEPFHILAGNLGPEAVRVFNRPLPELVIGVPAADVGHLFDVFRYRVNILQFCFFRFCHVFSYLPVIYFCDFLFGTTIDFLTQSLNSTSDLHNGYRELDFPEQPPEGLNPD